MQQEATGPASDTTSVAYRLDILRTFYRTTIGPVFPFNGTPSAEPPNSECYCFYHTCSLYVVTHVTQKLIDTLCRQKMYQVSISHWKLIGRLDVTSVMLFKPYSINSLFFTMPKSPSLK